MLGSVASMMTDQGAPHLKAPDVCSQSGDVGVCGVEDQRQCCCSVLLTSLWVYAFASPAISVSTKSI